MKSQPTKQHTTPCHDCPWRRNALSGWTGSLSPEQWTKEAHAESVIYCHTTFFAQCVGAAIFRSNVCKVPRDPSTLMLPRDTDRVFAHDVEFITYHTKDGRSPYVPASENPSDRRQKTRVGLTQTSETPIQLKKPQREGYPPARKTCRNQRVK